MVPLSSQRFSGQIWIRKLSGPQINLRLEASDDEAAVGCARDEIYKLLFSPDEINSRWVWEQIWLAFSRTWLRMAMRIVGVFMCAINGLRWAHFLEETSENVWTPMKLCNYVLRSFVPKLLELITGIVLGSIINSFLSAVIKDLGPFRRKTSPPPSEHLTWLLILSSLNRCVRTRVSRQKMCLTWRALQSKVAFRIKLNAVCLIGFSFKLSVER